MSERPTPETDAAADGGNYVSVGFAMRLENERDEAREKLKSVLEDADTAFYALRGIVEITR